MLTLYNYEIVVRSLNRTELQRYAKQYGIRANQKNTYIRQRLLKQCEPDNKKKRLSVGGTSFFPDEMETRADLLGLFSDSSSFKKSPKKSPALAESPLVQSAKKRKSLAVSKASPLNRSAVKKIGRGRKSKKISKSPQTIKIIHQLNLTPKSSAKLPTLVGRKRSSHRKNSTTPVSRNASSKMCNSPGTTPRRTPSRASARSPAFCITPASANGFSPLNRPSTSLLRSANRRSCVIGSPAPATTTTTSSVKRKVGRPPNPTTPASTNAAKHQQHRRRSTKMTPLVKEEFFQAGSAPIRRSLKFSDHEDDEDDDDPSSAVRYKLTTPPPSSRPKGGVEPCAGSTRRNTRIKLADSPGSPRVSPIQSSRRSRSMDNSDINAINKSLMNSMVSGENSDEWKKSLNEALEKSVSNISKTSSKNQISSIPVLAGKSRAYKNKSSFAKVHQSEFNKMDTLDEYIKKKRSRAEDLLNPKLSKKYGTVFKKKPNAGMSSSSTTAAAATGRKPTVSLATRGHLQKTLSVGRPPKNNTKDTGKPAKKAIAASRLRASPAKPMKTPLKSVLRKFDTPRTEKQHRVTIDSTPSFSRTPPSSGLFTIRSRCSLAGRSPAGGGGASPGNRRAAKSTRMIIPEAVKGPVDSSFANTTPRKPGRPSSSYKMAAAGALSEPPAKGAKSQSRRPLTPMPASLDARTNQATARRIHLAVLAANNTRQRLLGGSTPTTATTYSCSKGTSIRPRPARTSTATTTTDDAGKTLRRFPSFTGKPRTSASSNGSTWTSSPSKPRLGKQRWQSCSVSTQTPPRAGTNVRKSMDAKKPAQPNRQPGYKKHFGKLGEFKPIKPTL